MKIYTVPILVLASVFSVPLCQAKKLNVVTVRNQTANRVYALFGDISQREVAIEPNGTKSFEVDGPGRFFLSGKLKSQMNFKKCNKDRNCTIARAKENNYLSQRFDVTSLPNNATFTVTASGVTVNPAATGTGATMFDNPTR